MNRLLLVTAIVAFGCGEGGSAPPVDSAAPAVDAPRPVDAAPPDAPQTGVTCTQKESPVLLNFTCRVLWGACTDGSSYDLTCNVQNVGGNVFSLCDCIQDGIMSKQFISTTVCMSTTFEEVEAVVNENCLWELR